MEDRRTRKTKKLLQTSLLELLKTKQLREISVRELSDYADISRSTFYLHYTDIYDLMYDIEESVVDEIRALLLKHEPTELRSDISPLITDIFKYVNDNRELFLLFYENSTDVGFSEKIFKMIKEKCFYDWNSIFKNSNKENYEIYFTYITSGCLGIIKQWIHEKDRSVEEISIVAKNLIVSGVEIIKK